MLDVGKEHFYINHAIYLRYQYYARIILTRKTEFYVLYEYWTEEATNAFVTIVFKSSQEFLKLY